jgi:hypothetical protein
MRALRFLFLSSILASVSAFAKIAGMPLEEMVRKSDAIVIAHVDRVSAPLIGKKWAGASVTETWKGATDSEITFLASPTAICDISEAKKGETVVLFLIKDKRARRYVLALAGRGRMPVREVDGKRYATFWPEVRLPKNTPTIAGPEPKWDFIESVELERLHDLVKAVTSPCGERLHTGISKNAAHEIAVNEMKKHRRSLNKFESSIDSDISGKRWVVRFEVKNQLPYPGSCALVFVDKTTGDATFIPCE